MRKGLKRLCLFSVGVLLSGAATSHAFTLSTSVEAITIPGVGGTFTPVNFENTYSSPVVACTYNLASSANNEAGVRIQSAGPSGMQIRIQRPRNSAAVTPGTVFCLVAEEGVNTLPDGRRIEARRVLSTVTHGRTVPLGFGNGSPATMQNVSSQFSGFTNPFVLGQVMTFNDTTYTTFHSNDCDDRRNPPYDAGFADGICVTKTVSEDNIVAANETLGIIVIETGSGSYDGIAYAGALGADQINGVGNGGSSYSLGADFEFAVATLSGQDGGDGGWAVFLGGAAVGGSSLTIAIDEDTLNDAERNHTQEEVAYFAVRRTPLFTASKTVDRLSIAETLSLNYEIAIENTGQLDQTGVVISDVLPDGSAGVLSGPTESLSSDGVFEVGETWTYTVSYAVTPADISSASDLINTVTVSTDQYASEGFSDETATATTVIVPPNPSITVTKTADNDTNVPAGVTVTYTYVVQNTGNQFISNVSLTDSHNASGPVPTPGNETLSLDAGVIGDSTDGTSNDGIWDTLAPGDQITFTGTYVVTQNDVDTLQ